MFKQRLIMTIVLIPLVLLAIYFAPNNLFLGLTGILVFLMIFEWQQFLNFKNISHPIYKIILLVMGSVLVFQYADFFIYFDVGFWCLALFLVYYYPRSLAVMGSNGFIAANAWILLGVFASILVKMQTDLASQNLIVCLLFLVWAADIGAYLVGRKWGIHKMIPQVSPGKSWEGLIGGLFLVLLVALIEGYFIEPLYWGRWLVLAVITGLFSVVGDLWISVLKRHVGLKDTGHLIPGHGGILDRLDSLLAAMPIFYFGLKILGPIV